MLKGCAGHQFKAVAGELRLRQQLSALAYCHSKGIAHRDIKLENVMFNQQGVLRLIDYKRAAAMPTQPPFHSAVHTVCRSVMNASGM